MSKIFETLQIAEATRRTGPHVAGPGESSTRGRNRRRSQRWAFSAIIRVYGNTPDGNSFYEEARTINVSTHGALLELRVPVCVGQKLLLINEETQRRQICQIVNTRILETEALEVAVEFPVPHAEFWQVFSAPKKMQPSEDRRHEAPRVAGSSHVAHPN